MAERIIIVRAIWDDEAKVWVAESSDLPGLITEADTVEALLGKLQAIIPDLIEDEGGGEDLPDVTFKVMLDELSTGRRRYA